MRLGDLFAPAYNRNDPAAMAALEAWMARNQSLTNADVEATRRPASINTGDPGGMVDPEALRALAQGGPYDKVARRDAIAAQIAAQAEAAAAAAQAAPAAPVYAAQQLPPDMWQNAVNSGVGVGG